MNTDPKYEVKCEKIHVSTGNHKLGKIHNINLLPGDEPITLKDGTLLTTVRGTCDGVCDGCKNYCYAMRDTKLHHNVIIYSSGENTRLCRENPDEYFRQIEDYLKHHRVKIFRFHSSGEIPNIDYFIRMNKIAVKFPEIHFYCYTKRFQILENFKQIYGPVAKNMVVNCSEWNGNTAGYDLEGLNFFVWDDGNDPEIAKLPHCRAVSAPEHPGGKGHSTGVNCVDCGLCWKKNNGHRIAVYNH